jgi:hypothetical protein
MKLRSENHRTLIRIGAVLAATASSLIAWTAMVPLSGIELIVPTGSAVRTVGAADVAFAAVVSGLAAIGTTAVIGRRARHPRRAWTILATGVFVATLLGPITTGAETGIVWTLIALHSVVAVVLIPQLRWTLPEEGSSQRMETAAA